MYWERDVQFRSEKTHYEWNYHKDKWQTHLSPQQVKKILGVFLTRIQTNATLR